LNEAVRSTDEGGNLKKIFAWEEKGKESHSSEVACLMVGSELKMSIGRRIGYKKY
jgi:hypothetical protein